MPKTIPNLVMNFFIQATYFDAFETTIYLTLEVESKTFVNPYRNGLAIELSPRGTCVPPPAVVLIRNHYRPTKENSTCVAHNSNSLSNIC